MSKHVWKVWLRPNNLTSSKTDFIAEVDAAGKTRRMQDLIDRIMEEGSEVKAETVRAIADRLNAVKRDFILEGYSVFDDFAHFTPRVSGAWTGTEVFSPGKHRITVDAVMSGAMHNELGRVGVEVLGVTGPEGRIMLVTDIATGRSDGSVTPGDDIRIDGYKVKITGLPQPDGGTEPGIGVFFIGPDGRQWQAARVSENKPSHLLVRVPDDLPRLTCRLRIVTRYTRGVRLLKEPRIIEYHIPLTPIVP